MQGITTARGILGALVLALLASVARGQTDSRGRILERVVCRADASQSYALYVPAGYTAEKKWPVIFCFDPGGRGLVPVELLRGAAEKYGCIAAGSLTSRNGPYAASVAAARAMIADVSSRLRVDPGRVYTAGLSGGARVATLLAMLGLAKGVIACSAGFPISADGIPSRVEFSYFATAGTEDFNQSELRRLDRDLEDRKAVHRLVIHGGGHEWAPAALMSEAVAWMGLQAMRSGACPRDDAMIREEWQARVAALPTAPGPERWLALRALTTDFAGLADTGALADEAKKLGASREVKQWVKADRASLEREQSQQEELNELAAEGSPPSILKFAAQLRQKAEAEADSAERQMARRLIAGFAMNTREGTRALFEQEEYAKAAGLLEMTAALRPGRSTTYYDLARAWAFDGDRKRATEALKQAVEAGFRDAEHAQSDPAFKKLGGDPAFRELIARMKVAPEGASIPERGSSER
ncbi:MAG: hypothetical protein ABUL68_05675 [Pseudomonadota bacterium]